MAKKVTWEDIGEHHHGKNHLIEKESKVGYYSPRANGRSSVQVTCPFCETTIDCYLWSFTACGKRCDCGAMLARISAYHFKEETVNE